ncbi:MAG: hypothetical protein LUI14_13785, partial [Lachnospiraceae bacterium]|nr:hypothetical protein [Lachnospiraceae bacterium]
MLYLTYRERNEDGSWQLAIPNRKIHDLFERQIKTWFFTHIEGGMEPLYKAFDSQNIEEIEKCINACMTDSIMFRESPPLKFAYGEGRAYVHDSLRESGQVMDGGNTDEAKETFYHGLL